MGEYDLVKIVVGDSGNVQLWRVAIKPAKPFAFGTIWRELRSSDFQATRFRSWSHSSSSPVRLC